MADTYGFGGSEPTRDLPNRDGDGVKSNTGNTTAPEFGVLDGMYTDNIRGQSPVSGLMSGDPVCDSDWETTSIHPSSLSNVGVGSGLDTTLGAWPIREYGNNPRQKANRGEGPADWTGSHPGSVD